jgi:hypothetical protein
MGWNGALEKLERHALTLAQGDHDGSRLPDQTLVESAAP